MTKKDSLKQNKKKLSSLGFKPRIPALRPTYCNCHTIDFGAEIPSSTYIHIENYITHYKSVLQFEILKKTSQPRQVNQINVPFMAITALPTVQMFENVRIFKIFSYFC